ncbi:MAG: formylglycine-generating enzyme family protein [Planctomycetota bacterium]
MNDSGRSSLRIGAVCAAAIGGVMLTVGMAQTSRTLMEFHGVTPGESSTDSLRAGEWKQVVSQSTTADGMRRLEFHIAPWKKVVVVAKDDRVVGIDLFAPRGLTSQKVCDAFGLGRVMPTDQLPPEARFATEGIAGELLESPAAFVLLEMEDQDGLQRVRRIRFFGNRPLAAGRGAERGRPAPAIQPDPSGRPAAAVAPFNVQQAGAHQQAWAKYLGQPVEVTNSIGMKLRLIPPGEFMMGSPSGDSSAEDDEQPQHQVRITQPFYLGMTEVTQGQWRSVMGTEPWKKTSVKKGSDYAATYVSWEVQWHSVRN